MHGPGASTATVDSLLMLRLAENAFRLLTKVAENGKMVLTLTGLEVKEKCVAVVVRPSDKGAATLSVNRTLRLVAGEDVVPKGLIGAVEELRKDLRGLATGVTANFKDGGRAKRLEPPPLPVADLPWEETELRVTPVRVGGADPGAQLSSTSEVGLFTVDVTEEDARKLGASLYREVDVRIEIVRGVDRRIERGRIVEVIPLDAEEPATAWREWFAKNAPEWDPIDDVRGALGRGFDD